MKRVSKRSIQRHLKRDQADLQSISQDNTDLILFVQSHIDRTIKLLSGIHGGHIPLDIAPDHDRSQPEGSEGAILKTFKVIDLYLIIIIII